MHTHAFRRFIVPFGLVAALAVGFFWFGKSTIADTIFSDSFGTVDSSSVPGWFEFESSSTKASISDATPSPFSATDGHVVLWGGGIISREVSTLGFKDIQLSYFWLGDLDSVNSSDSLEVGWRVMEQATTTIASHLLAPPIGWSTQQTHSLGASANNATIEINFRGNTPGTTREANVDDVLVTGTPIGSITIEKITVPSGDAQLFDFDLAGPDPRTTQVSDTGGPVTLDEVTTGAYTLTETVPTGWDFTDLECAGAASGFVQNGSEVSFTLAQGEHISCSFSNTKRGSITVHKEVLSPNGFNPIDDRDFTALLNGGSAQTFSELSPTTYANLLPGTYTITESITLPTQFTFASFSEDDNVTPADGAQITISPGENVTLTITNTQKPADFIVAKNVFAPDGTSEVIDPHPFTITLTGSQGHVTSTTVMEGANVSFSIDPEVDYTVSEASDADYDFLGCFLDDGTPTCIGNVSSNSNTTRYVRNKQKNGSITVQKDVRDPDGGEVSDMQSFTVNVDGQNEQTIAEGAPFSYTSLAPGTYTINEVNLPAGYAFGSFSIDEDAQTEGAQVTIGSNDAPTLTITNRQQKGTIIVYKDVVGFDGNPIIDNNPFTATVTGQPNQQFAENDPAEFSVNPGCYTVGELDHPNYDLVSIDPSAEVCVDPGGTAEVTITNKPSGGIIVVEKIIQNPSGQTDLTDDSSFTVTVPGQPNQNISQTVDAVFTVGPGQYCIGEVDFPGYDLVSISPQCVFITSGATANVTITNRQRPATIIVEKNVLDPDGGEVSDPTPFPILRDEIPQGVVTELVSLTLTGITPFVPTTVSEDDVPGYDMDIPQTIGPLNPGSTTTVQFVNRQRKAKVEIAKDVRDPDGNQIEDDHQFEVTLENQTQPFAERATSTFMVNPGTYSIAETFDQDFDADSNNQDEVTIGPGATTTVMLVNRQKRGKIEVVKDVRDPDLGPADDTTPFTVTVEDIGSLPLMEGATTTFDNLLPGTYTLSELTPSTHDLVGFSPDATVVVGSNETVIVYVTNKQHPATIIVHKNIVGPDGVTEVNDSHVFTVCIDGNGGCKPVSENNPATYTVYPGLRTATENPDFNYDLVGIDPSANVTILPDETVELWVTNKPKAAKITVNKIVWDTEGQPTPDLHVFSVTIGTETKTVVQGTPTDFYPPPGCYTPTEAPDSGYDLVSVSLANFCIGSGQELVISLTNRQRPGKIVVIKDVIGPNGEDAHDPAVFQIQFNSNPDQPLIEGATTTFDNLIPGTYTLTETQGQGYDAGIFSTTTPIFLDPGETVTVTITNRQQPGSISGKKFNDVNGNSQDDGEPGLPGWTITLNPGNVSTTTDTNGVYSFEGLAAGSYTLTETIQSGWIQTAAPTDPIIAGSGQDVLNQNFGNFKLGSIAGMKWNDLNGDGVKDENEPGLVGWTITLNPGNFSTTTDANGNYSFEGLTAGTYIVTEVQNPVWDQTFPSTPGTHTVQITSGAVEAGKDFGNRLRRGTIIIEKQTLPDGDPELFTFTGNPSGIIGDGGALTEDVEPGQYQSTELIPERWMIESIICDDVNSSGDPQTGVVTFNVEPGEEVRCIVTNKKAARIAVRKTSVGNVEIFHFRGDLGEFDIETIEPGVPVDSFFDIFVDVAGTDLDVTEDSKVGWDADTYSCELRGVLPGVSDPLCEFTNTKLGRIIVEKATIGGDDDFGFTTDYGDPFTLSNGESNDSGFLPVPATYSVSESVPPGWDLTSAVCSDESNPNAIQLDAGETVTCTFTNTKRGMLTIIKNAVGSDDTFTFSHPTSTDTFQLTTVGGVAQTVFELLAGEAYNVSESVPPGWDPVQDPLHCEGVMAAGGEVTCTFINTKRGTLTVVKEAVGGDAIFTFTKPTTTEDTFELATQNGRATTTFELAAGTVYSVDEGQTPTGWDEANNPACQGTLQPGGNQECRFRNIKRGKIIVDKVTDPSGDLQQFEFTPSWDDPFSLTDTDAPYESEYLAPGVYSVTEAVEEGWDSTSATCDDGSDPSSIVLDPGVTVTCTFVNTKRPTLTVEKIVVNDNGGTKQAGDFPLFVDGQPVTSGIPVVLAVGAHTVSETEDLNYSASFGGACSAGTWDISGTWTITLLVGATPYVHSMTVSAFDPANGEFSGTGFYTSNPAYTWDAIGTVSGSNISYHVVYTGLNPGYTFDASGTIAPDGLSMSGAWDSGTWSATGAATLLPENIVLAPAENAVCTITNDDIPATITLKKEVQNDDGGDKAPDDFILKINDTIVERGVPHEVIAGIPIEITELELTGYTPISIIGEGCPSALGEPFTLAINEHITCTITNDDQSGALIVQKTTYPSGILQEFTITASGTGTIKNGAQGAVSDAQDYEYIVTAGTYNVAEAPQTGWMEVSNTCVEVVVGIGEEVTCEIVNKKSARIAVRKTSVGDVGLFPFTATANSTSTEFDIETIEPGVPMDSFFDIFVDIAGESVTVAEGVPPGWSVDQQTCSLTSVMPGDPHHSCEFTNTKRGTIVIEKQTLPDGETQEFEFTGQPAGTVGDDGELSEIVEPGQYQSTETIPPQWMIESIACDDENSFGDQETGTITFNIDPGEEVRCVVTNKKAAHLTIRKTTIGGIGTFHFRGDLGEFDIETLEPGIPVDSFFDIFVDIASEDVSVSEDVPAGWSVDQQSCLITAGPGDESTCPFTNTKLGIITGIKFEDLNGNGSKGEGEPSLEGWTIELRDDQGILLDSAATGPDGSYSFESLAPGEYQVHEQEQEGWHKTEPGGPYHPVTLAAGETAVRHFGNLKLGKIKVDKVTNPSGDSQEFEFTPSWDDPFFLTDTDAPYESDYLTPDTYSLSEIVPSGWDLATATCDDGSDPSAIALGAGETVTCTFENTKRSTLHVVKELPNDDGGDAAPNEFSFSVNGGAPIQFESDGQNDIEVDADTYTIVETNPQDGYEVSYQNCSDVVLPPGGEATCTITNDDKEATITIEKILPNDDGGTLTQNDFSYFIDGNPAILGVPVPVGAGPHLVTESDAPGYARSFSNACSTVEGWDLSGQWALDFILSSDSSHRFHAMDVASFNPNTGAFSGTGSTTGTVPPPAPVLYTWTMIGTETGNSFALTTSYNEIPGYQVALIGTLDSSGQMSGTWADNAANTGTFTGTGQPEPLAGKVTVGLGDEVTCTITNDDEEATLTVEKIVTNDNGGGAVIGDFTLRINSNPVASGIAQTLVPGAYTVSEDPETGYIGTIGGDCAPDGSVTLNLGDHKTCTITNNDQPTTLTVHKVVINNDGGSAGAGNFTLRIDGNQVVIGVANPVSAGLHTVSEDIFPGYTGVIGGDCAPDGTVMLAAGDQKTCTINNDDQPGMIHVIKILPNNDGGTATPEQFSFSINGGAPIQLESDGQNDLTVDAGMYTIIETNPQTGYAVTYDNCDNLVIPNGGEETCTITNDDGQATLIVKKEVNNDDFGNATPSQFFFSINDGPPIQFEPDGENELTVDAGVYTIVEVNTLPGYAVSYEDCENVILASGEGKTCTITNNDVEVFGSIAGYKWLDRDEDGVKDLTEPLLPGWTITLNPGGRTATTDADGAYEFDNVSPGAYAVAEVLQAGWHQTYPVSPGAHTVTITGAGEDVTGKNFGNILPPSVSGVKFEDNNGNGTREQGEPLLPGWTIRLKNLSTSVTITAMTDASGAYRFANLTPGVSYRISEVVKTGWVQTMPANPDTYAVTLQNGDTATGRDFGNFKLAEIRGLKYEDRNGNGRKDGSESALSGWTIYIDANNNGSLDGSEQSVETGPSGTYALAGLPPGTHRVREVMLTSLWGQSQPGPLLGSRYDITPQSGQVVAGAHFGNYRFAEIHGRKYQDDDMNGRKNGTEQYLNTWVIELTHLESGLVKRDTTHGAGRYDFTGLAPGNYRVREILKSGWVPISPRDTVHRVTLVSGQNLTGLLFGNVTVAQFAASTQGVSPQSLTATTETLTAPAEAENEIPPPTEETQSASLPLPSVPQNFSVPTPPDLHLELKDRLKEMSSRLRP